MLVTLIPGSMLIALLMAGLSRWSRLPIAWAALLTGLLALSAYLPYAILHWQGADVLAMHVAVYAITVFASAALLGQRRRARGAHTGGDAAGPAAIWTFFAVILVMNAAFIAVSVQGLPDSVQTWLLPDPSQRAAVQTAFPGVVADHYYQKEQQFNRHLQAMDQQRRRAWQVQVGWVGQTPRAGAPFTVQVRARRRDTSPLRGAQVEARWLRPSDSGLDVSAVLQEVSPGVYESDVLLPAPGQWQLVVDVAQGAERHQLRAATRLDGSG